ncbi:mannose-binding protein [Streptomyces pseudovenezuelae]|uniref:mannose-binding protein n=1 Tax=Streptomyces pseudovenezuelae TaxID=67350 RepID=UPI002E802985|nr:mannose-binding protein [Streptomyces pseudovenezuelae]WUA93792.1 mannose-binding protein [Streptomyces pseudovenezuelae]
MSAQRNAGDGTSPGTAQGAPQIRVAVALPASSEPPEGTLTPGRITATGPDTTNGEPAQHEPTVAGSGPEKAAEEEAGPTTTLSDKAAAREADEALVPGEADRAETDGGAAAPQARSEADEAATAMASVSTAAEGPSGDADAGESRGGRPKKPMLAAAGIVGAVLVAVPFLLMGGQGDDTKQKTANSVGREDSDTLLGANAAQEAPEDYATQTPSATPSKKAAKKSAKPSPAEATPSVNKAADTKSKPTHSATPSAKATRPKAPVWTSTSVTAPSTLSVGESWSTNRIKMVMQADGNLVVYNEKGKATWASMTFGENHTARFQTDGNLVIHNGDDRPIWGADVWGHPGAKLILRTDGKVVIMDGTTMTWST